MENITELFKKNGCTFSSMDISIELKKKFAASFYTYATYLQLFCEILAFGSYEASYIHFRRYTYINNDFLCIHVKDGGLSEKNKEALKSIYIGKSTNQNISYFGAGAKTAARQWTKDCSGKYFVVCDSDNEIIYSTEGCLGLEVINNYDKDLFKKNYNLKIENGYTCWVLPFNEKIWNEELEEKLMCHFNFMYNDRLNNNLKIKFFERDTKPTINIFKNTNTKLDKRIIKWKKSKDTTSIGTFNLEFLNKKYNLFSHIKGKVKMVSTRPKLKTFKGANMNGHPGKSLKIFQEDNNGEITEEIYYHYYKSNMCKKYNESAYLYDDTASDWGNDGIYFNEEFDFSAEIMSIPGKINPRREQFIQQFNIAGAKDINGIRFLMKDKLGSNFIDKNAMKKGMQFRGPGTKNGVFLCIYLTKEQYQKYAQPNIRRTEQWDCHNKLKETADNLYNYICKLAIDYHRKVMEAYEEKIEEITILNWNSKLYNEIAIKKFQKNYKIFIMRRREEERKKRRRRREKELEERRKVNKKEYERLLNIYIKNQEDKTGFMYIRSTKRMRQDGNEKYGNPIINTGLSKKPEIRHKTYLNYEHLPIEELDERWVTSEKVYNVVEAEREWQKRLRSQNFGLKEIEAARGNTVTTDEMFVTDIKTILKYRDLAIEQQKKAYFTDIENIKNDLLKKYPH
jgi:hypothetical protein